MASIAETLARFSRKAAEEESDSVKKNMFLSAASHFSLGAALIRDAGGPENIPGIVVVENKEVYKEEDLQTRIIDFFYSSESEATTYEEKYQLMEQFNEEVGSKVSDEVRIASARIPTYPYEGLSPEMKEKVKKIKPGVKNFFNRPFNRLSRMDSLNTIGEFRNADISQIPARTSSATLIRLLKVAFARPTTPEIIT